LIDLQEGTDREDVTRNDATFEKRGINAHRKSPRVLKEKKGPV